jgi:Mn2+/Fe2+ NRAMP family transporter
LPKIELNKAYLFNLIAILGTTISPYLFFWQSDEETEELRAEHKIGWTSLKRRNPQKSELKQMRWDTVVGMVFSNAIMFFIIVTSAGTLHLQGITQVDTAQQAALALQPIAGQGAYLLFALGIIGTGLLAVPILSGSAAYAVAEVCNWKYGLSRQFSQAKQFYLVMAAGVIVGMILNFMGFDPFRSLYISAVVNGLVAPFLIVMLLLITNNKKIMGKYTNSLVSNILGIITVIVMSAAGIALIVSTVLRK